MNKIKNIYKDNDLVYVPTTIDNLCNGEVVVMEYCDGVFLDDIEGIKKYGFDSKEIITDLNNVFYEMIFKHGTIHSDPHAKNILIRPNPK